MAKSRIKLRTKVKEDNLRKALDAGHITAEQAQEVIDTNGLYNPYTDTYTEPVGLREVEVVAKRPQRQWTSEWSYNDPEFRLRQYNINEGAEEVANATRNKMNQSAPYAVLAPLAGAAGPLFGVASELAPMLAPGTAGGNMIGNLAKDMLVYEGFNRGTKAVTGTTLGDLIRYGLDKVSNGYIPASAKAAGPVGEVVYDLITEAPTFTLGSKVVAPMVESGAMVVGNNVTKLLNKRDIINTWRKAAAAGDTRAANKALLEWWKLKAPDNFSNQAFLHSGRKGTQSWTIFDLSRLSPESSSFSGRGIYLSGTEIGDPASYRYQTALKFNRVGPNGEILAQGAQSGGPETRFFYVRGNKEIPRGDETLHLDELPNYAYVDNRPTEIVAAKSNNIKLADPFTYDDNGKLIDITKRFDFTHPDIRYKTSDDPVVSSIVAKWQKPIEQPLVPTALEYLERQDNIAPTRIKFIDEHPIDESQLRNGVTMDEIRKAASREYAINNKDSYKFLENQILYESPWLKAGQFGSTERNAVGTHGMYGYSINPKAEGKSKPIDLMFAAEDSSPLARITKNHEALHGSGSDEVGEYIYLYLTQNGIIDPNGMNTYYKSGSEMATHFSELFDFLGFKAGRNGGIIGPNGKTAVTEKDIDSFLLWMGQPQQTSKGAFIPGGDKRGMFANIKDKKAFVKFCNEFLGSLATPVAVGTGIASSDNKFGGKLNYFNYFK